MGIPEEFKDFIRKAIEEDLGSGDLTTGVLVPREHTSEADLVAKGAFVVSGLPFAEEVFKIIDRGVKFTAFVEDGFTVRKSDVIARVSGKTASLLEGERVALNILQRLSGIATLTNKFVMKTKGLDCKVLDTRKTTPGMRKMEKYAVRTGGGDNHRMGLYDGMLIKDNHIRAVGGIKKAVRLAKRARTGLKIEIEAETLAEVKEALSAGVDIIMLDNMPLKAIKSAVRLVKGQARIEVSGNVTLRSIREIAETGVDYISVGALTHSAPAVDISMRFK